MFPIWPLFRIPPDVILTALSDLVVLFDERPFGALMLVLTVLAIAAVIIAARWPVK